MAWLKLLYFFVIGVLLTAFSFRRARGVYNFVKMVSQMPGPRWWDLVTVHVKQLLSDDPVTLLTQLCAEYSYKPWGFPTTTLGFVVVVSDPDTARAVFKNPHMCDKSSALYDGFADYLEKGSLVLNGEHWKWHRKIVSPAFRKSNLDSRMDLISEGAGQLVEALRAKANGPSFDITHLIDFWTTNISLRFITNDIPVFPDTHLFQEAVDVGMSLVHLKAVNPLYHWYLLKFDKKARKLDRFVRSIVEECKSLFKEARVMAKNQMSNRGDSHPADVVECLLPSSLDSELKVDDQELLDEALTIAVGALETTRTVVKTVMMLLALHPEEQERVFKEMEMIFGEGCRQPSPEDLQGMKYLDAVIKESLRLYPAIPIIARDAKRLTTVNGTSVAGGAVVVVNLMALHRNPKFFKDPLTFSPERFFGEGEAKRHPYAYMPFSSGPRMCVGHLQAVMTLKIVLSAILRNFEILPGENIKGVDDLKIKMSISITLREPMVKLITRKKNVVN